MLTREQIQKHVPALLTGLIDPDIQYQPCGVDLTVSQVFAFFGTPTIGFYSKDTRLPELQEIKPEKGYYFLKPGAYKVILNETVSIPKDLCAIARPRSSLLRSGLTVNTALWDPGYTGRSEVMLVVQHHIGAYLAENARIAQMCFLELDEETDEYSGSYQFENLLTPA